MAPERSQAALDTTRSPCLTLPAQLREETILSLCSEDATDSCVTLAQGVLGRSSIRLLWCWNGGRLWHGGPVDSVGLPADMRTSYQANWQSISRCRRTLRPTAQAEGATDTLSCLDLRLVPALSFAASVPFRAL